MNNIPKRYQSLKMQPIELPKTDRYVRLADTFSSIKKFPKFFYTWKIIEKMIEDSGKSDVQCQLDYTRSSYFIRVWNGDVFKDKYGFDRYPNELLPDPQKLHGVIEVQSFRNDNDVSNTQVDIAIDAVKKYLDSISLPNEN